MRRKPGALVPLEVSALAAAVALKLRGVDKFHGYQLAREIQEQEQARSVAGHGSLYKALSRLEAASLLSSQWEDPTLAEAEKRPRRRLYEITAEGQRAYAEAERTALRPAGTVTGRPVLA
jgi:PadR family transcriptional regulator, regulatory protein PadR